MHRRHFLATVAVSAPAIGFAAPVPKPKGDWSLYVIENLLEGDALRHRRVVRIPVKDGKVGEPEGVVTARQELFGHNLRCQLIDDRYIVSYFGAVIDLKTKEVVRENRGLFFGVDGTQVHFWDKVEDRVNGEVDALDLTTRKVTRLKKPERFGRFGGWSRDGTTISPDGTKCVISDGSELAWYTPTDVKKALGDGYLLKRSVNGSEPLVMWLDDNQILARTNSNELVTVNATTGKQTNTIPLPTKLDFLKPSRLWRDGADNIVYVNGQVCSRIDLKAKKAEPYEWHQYGHGFECSVVANLTDESTIRHKGEKIGTGIVASWDFDPKATDGMFAYIALKPRHLIRTPSTSWELRIWSAATGTWTTIPMYPNALVGWVRGG